MGLALPCPAPLLRLTTRAISAAKDGEAAEVPETIQYDAVLIDDVAVVAGRGERDVRHGSHAVGRRRAADTRLPGRLRIDGAGAAARGPQARAAVGCAFVPYRLRNVAEGRALVRADRGGPVLRGVGALIELRSADAGGVGRAAQAVDAGHAAGGG